jgi:hypothetical protein
MPYLAMEEMPVVHLDDNNMLSPFISADWIGTGKTFMIVLPQQVLAENQRKLIISKTYFTHFLSLTVSVARFIELKLPFQSTEIIATSTSAWFIKEPAHKCVWILLNRPVPSREFLTYLKWCLWSGMARWCTVCC